MKKIAIFLLFFITSCTKYTDLNELSIIKSIGIAYENNYTLYAEIYDEIKKDNIPQTKIIKASGKTINKAFQNIQLMTNKDIFFSHIDLLILDINLTDNNYQEIIDFFINNNHFRNDYFCFFSNNIDFLLNNSKYNEIENFLNTNYKNKIIVKKSFDEIINNYLEKKSFTLPLIVYDQQIKYSGNYYFSNDKIEGD